MTVSDVYNVENEKVSELELRDDIFDVPVKGHLLHQVVVAQLAKRRSGTAATKNRSAVKCSGSKLWRQKGTGRARVGRGSSPTRRGGGVAFGPSLRDYSKKVPKKVRKAALRMALTDKLRNNLLIIIDDFSLPEIKTKNFVGTMRNFDVRKALIVTKDKSENLEKSSRNVPFTKVMRHEGLNVYDILRHDHLFLELPAVQKIEEALIS
ncbi:MAG: 50S ribosomal protein L4 [Deltaproteobacteria bacterium]|nr:50S ribosomal protein L4 [Deltaproteobacteria bacterium]MBW2048093.1 50S ribosomal protein L4 [Deltaproteobacteria bacterium]MBW2110477.1 50S ribosomal protein L4 [Deltaproteobacteria bacterium]MBW2352640.1 50S ribosomal protein L4 [Deltaproteobacteria bacterium]HDZ90840.1 50S ribosomal protein L4 [Deltaproteobacteria bacterium]